MSERKAHREICGLCHEVNRVGFHVPDDVWEAATHISRRQDIHCLACFTRLADERGVEWDRDITFYPVSRVTFDRLEVPCPNCEHGMEAQRVCENCGERRAS